MRPEGHPSTMIKPLRLVLACALTAPVTEF
jgi:hypothetical protein